MDITSLITAVAALISAVLAAWNRSKISQTDGKVDTIHVLVNSQLEEIVRELAQMTAERDKLKEILSPPDPSKETKP